jgi:peroxiredoxin
MKESLMLRRENLLLIAATIMTFYTVGCNGAAVKSDGKGTSKGVSASSFEATDLNGDDFSLATHLGKDVVVISFWATWCEPCKAEMPTLQKMHDLYGKKGLKIISVSGDGPDTQVEVAPYIRSNRYTFTVVIDEDSSIAQAYNPRNTMPFMVLINNKGQVVKRIAGFQLSEAAHLVAEVKKLVETK